MIKNYIFDFGKVGIRGYLFNGDAKALRKELNIKAE